MNIKVSKQRGKNEWWVEAYESGGSPIFHAMKCVYKNPLNGLFYFDHCAFDTLDQAMRLAKITVRCLAKGEPF